MTTITPRELVASQHLGTSASDLYQATTTAIMTAISGVNTSGSVVTVSAHIVPSGGSDADANLVVDAQPVARTQSR